MSAPYATPVLRLVAQRDSWRCRCYFACLVGAMGWANALFLLVLA